MPISILKKHRMQTGKVYGGAVNKKRKRYCRDLETGYKHGSDLKPITRKDGTLVMLEPNQKSYCAGYVEGVADCTAAAKTAAGIDTRTSIKDAFTLNVSASKKN